MNVLIVLAASYLYLVIIVVAVGYVLLQSRQVQKQIGLMGLCSLVVAFVLLKLASLIIHNPRPFVVEHVTPLIPHAADNGFPSDHTTLSMTVAAIIFVYNRRLGIVLGLLAVVVGAARVLAKVHHPIDIIGGAVIAVVAVGLCWYVLKRKGLVSQLSTIDSA